jgi:hypothetical protein
MTSVEQHKMVQQLKQKTSKMKPEERRMFEMMAKRDKDDEDLDTLTFAQLKQLHQKFYPKHSKVELEDRWKKMTSGE